MNAEDGLYYDDECEEEDYEQDDWDTFDCGYDPEFEGICWDVGSEWCSFHCPFHNSFFHPPVPDIPF